MPKNDDHDPSAKKKIRPRESRGSSLKKRARLLPAAHTLDGVLTDSSTRGTKFPSADERRQRVFDRFDKQKEERERELDRRRLFEVDEGFEMPDHGIVDTLRLSLMGPLVDLDRRALVPHEMSCRASGRQHHRSRVRVMT